MAKENESKLTANREEEQPASDAETAQGAEDEAGAVDVQSLKQEIERLKAESEHHLDQWKRTAANLENYRRRVEKERGDILKAGQATLIAQLLPVLDDLERAFQTLPTTLRNLTWTDGVALIGRKVNMVLEQHGLKEIEALGQPFDPARHQSILQEDTTDYPDGHVIAVLQKGYQLHDKVLRPAMVKIAVNERGSKPASNAQQTEEETAEAETKGESATAHEDSSNT
jgi:molecular chaperone GrpE